METTRFTFDDFRDLIAKIAIQEAVEIPKFAERFGRDSVAFEEVQSNDLLNLQMGIEDYLLANSTTYRPGMDNLSGLKRYPQYYERCCSILGVTPDYTPTAASA